MLPGITKEGQESTKLDMREKICGVDTSPNVCMLVHFVERQMKESRTYMPMHNECQSQNEKPEIGGRHEDDGESREEAKILFLLRGIS